MVVVICMWIAAAWEYLCRLAINVNFMVTLYYMDYDFLLSGQFLDRDIEIDENEKVLLIPGQDPIPVVKRQVWRFVEKNIESGESDDHFCWTTVHPSSQGHGIIKGTFLDYKVQHILAV